ncbi:MAG: hypothetical protein ABEL76_04410, partial [Bradymonadaceae bacterium]
MSSARLRSRRSGRLLATLLLGVAAFAFAASGCGNSNGGGGISGSNAGTLIASPETVAFQRVPLGESATKTLNLRNTGERDLKIFNIDFGAREGATIEPFNLKGVPNGSFTIPVGKQR